jgi:uncharacterized protein YggT (Ycf19 family)
MRSLRVLCWIWIVVSTLVILFSAPVSVTRKNYTSDSQVTRIEWIGPFGEPFRSYAVSKSSIDFSRLIVVLLAVNFLPLYCFGGMMKLPGGWSVINAIR